jgi:hypothetical protein
MEVDIQLFSFDRLIAGRFMLKLQPGGRNGLRDCIDNFPFSGSPKGKVNVLKNSVSGFFFSLVDIGIVTGMTQRLFASELLNLIRGIWVNRASKRSTLKKCCRF